MMVAKTFVETDQYDPNDPQQKIREYYGYRYGPGSGGWQTTYYNRVADAGQLKGLGASLSWASLPSWVQIGIVGLSSAAVGYWGMKRWGDSVIKPALRKIGIGR